MVDRNASVLSQVLIALRPRRSVSRRDLRSPSPISTTEISKSVKWEPCSKECTGVRVGSDGKCLAHTRDDRDHILRDLLAADRPLDFARGVTIDPTLLGAILNAARNREGRPCLRNASFASATFHGDADFH